MSKNKYLFLLLFIFVSQVINAQADCYIEIEHDKSPNHSATYKEMISYYHRLARCHSDVDMQVIGQSDFGESIHAVIIDRKQQFKPLNTDDQRSTVLINNAIHAGEPCGVDASMQLTRDLLFDIKNKSVLDNIVLVIIPAYNIGGMHRRNAYSRANQVGPAKHGFRANAKNLDLNRDFIKCDSKNAHFFSRFFNHWNPDVFVDTHTTNGADYPYNLTLIANLQARLTPPLSELIYDNCIPKLFEQMAQQNDPIVPYVQAMKTPKEGIVAFQDLPRYAMGYAALHHTLAFTTEAHMLKPFDVRVASTRRFLNILLNWSAENSALIKKARTLSYEVYAKTAEKNIAWELIKKANKQIPFKGYEAKYKDSEISGLERLYYDQDSVYEKDIPFYDDYEVVTKASNCSAYIIPQAWDEIIERLKWNGVSMQRIQRDTQMLLEVYYIDDYETTKTPYEGHYLHSKVKVHKETKLIDCRRGDFYINMDQNKARFIVEVLEPQAPDAYFAWNFFDAILQQKEYFSSYVFEETALELLMSDEQLILELEAEIKKNPKLKENGYKQLEFIYKRSPYYENTVGLYPVYRQIN